MLSVFEMITVNSLNTLSGKYKAADKTQNISWISTTFKYK